MSISNNLITLSSVSTCHYFPKRWNLFFLVCRALLQNLAPAATPAQRPTMVPVLILNLRSSPLWTLWSPMATSRPSSPSMHTLRCSCTLMATPQVLPKTRLSWYENRFMIYSNVPNQNRFAYNIRNVRICNSSVNKWYGALFLQHKVAQKAITDLASMYGTRYRFGSIINTICEFLKHWLTVETGSILKTYFHY